jgi:hypothetical protein
MGRCYKYHANCDNNDYPLLLREREQKLDVNKFRYIIHIIPYNLPFCFFALGNVSIFVKEAFRLHTLCATDSVGSYVGIAPAFRTFFSFSLL